MTPGIGTPLQAQVPWAALEGGVLMQQQIGHSEPRDSVTNAVRVRGELGQRHTGRTLQDFGRAAPYGTPASPGSAAAADVHPRRQSPDPSQTVQRRTPLLCA
jgi:hypothetical protein